MNCGLGRQAAPVTAVNAAVCMAAVPIASVVAVCVIVIP